MKPGVVASSARTLGTLGLLTAALPFNAALTGVALARLGLSGHSDVEPVEPVETPTPRRTVLLTGGKMTKALQLARAFHAAGHRVVLVESPHYRLTGHRFSRAVDVFRTVPESRDPGYADALERVVREEGVDVVVPVCSPASSLPDALAKPQLTALGVDVVHLDPDHLPTVDDKHAFARAAEALGLDVPETHLVTDPAQVRDFDFAAHPERRYVLKSIAYDPVRRVDLTPLPRPTAAETASFVGRLPISPDNPWILQELVTGREFCTHGTVRDGRLTVYCCCASSAVQLNYDSLDEPDVEKWVRAFVESEPFTGQLSFDLMRCDDGRVLGLECNPRTHSAITLFDHHPDLAAAYLDAGFGERDGIETPDGEPARPLPAARPTYWAYHEAWRLLRHPGTARERWRVLSGGRDAVFSWDDPLPFFVLHHVQVPALLLDNLRRRAGWTRIDFNIGKLVEPGGD